MFGPKAVGLDLSRAWSKPMKMQPKFLFSNFIFKNIYFVKKRNRVIQVVLVAIFKSMARFRSSLLLEWRIPFLIWTSSLILFYVTFRIAMDRSSTAAPLDYGNLLVPLCPLFHRRCPDLSFLMISFPLMHQDRRSPAPIGGRSCTIRWRRISTRRGRRFSREERPRSRSRYRIFS